MKIQKSLFTTALFGASLASAALLVEETFDYTVGNNIGSVEATGTGLTGEWQRTFTDGASAILRVYEYNDWSVPDNTYAPSSRRVGTPVDQNNSAAVNLSASAQINFDADGVMYYSYLLNYGTDNRSRVSFGSATTPDLMRVQGIAGGTLRVYAGGDFTAGGALAADTDFLVVGRITTSAAGNDEHRIWVYDGTESVALSDPGTTGSDAVHSAAITGTADMLQFSNLIDASYGDFRMGSTWEAVAIPEPSTLVLVGTVLGGFALFRRRRVK